MILMSTHMDESCVFLINLHQLLVSFVPHAGLWVRAHCNEVGYTLHTQRESLRMFQPKPKIHNLYFTHKKNNIFEHLISLTAAAVGELLHTCTGWMRPWLSVSAMTLRAKCRTLDWVWKNASSTCFR